MILKIFDLVGLLLMLVAIVLLGAFNIKLGLAHSRLFNALIGRLDAHDKTVSGLVAEIGHQNELHQATAARLQAVERDVDLAFGRWAHRSPGINT